MTFPLTLPTIGSTSWGTDVNANWTTINDAFQTLAPFTGKVTVTPTAVSSGTQTALQVTGAANTGMTASTEVNDVKVNLSRTVQWATGAITTQRAVLIQPPTYGFVGASTITTAATLAVSGAPVAGTNATLTNSYALWIQAGTSRFGGLLLTNAPASGGAGFNLPHGSAPSSAVDGDVWTTSTGLYVRINGSTVGPLGTGGGGGGLSGAGVANQIAYWSGTTSLTGLTGFTFTPGTPNSLAVPGTLALTPAAGTGAVASVVVVTAAADTALTASTERIDVNINLARTAQFATGAMSVQRAVAIQAPTYGFVGASTITTAATLAITGAPVAGTNATVTNAYAFWVQAGIARFDGGITSPRGSLTTHSEFFGLQAGNGSYTASNALAVGYQALTALTSGADLTAMGASAGAALTNQARWTLVGYSAGAAGGSGNDVVAVGWNAAANATGGASIEYVTALGSEACRYVNASTNIGIGYQAGRGSTTPSNNTGDANIAIGYQALLAYTSGDDNIAVGYQTLTSLTTGRANVVVGISAATAITSGSSSVYIGSNAGGGATTVTNSVFIGENTGLNLGIAAGNGNIAIGHNAFSCSGTPANNDSDANIAIGSNVMASVSHGSDNVGIGEDCLNHLTSGGGNVAIGGDTLENCTTTMLSVAVGYAALGSCQTGDYNVAVGPSALLNLTTGGYNVGIGFFAGSQLETGSNNLFIGPNAGQHTDVNVSRKAIFCGFNDFYFGKGGDLDDIPDGNVTFNATSGLGTNVIGTDFTIAAGAPTGNAVGGDVIFRTAIGGSSGTTLRSLIDRFVIQSDGGWQAVGIATSSAPGVSPNNAGVLYYDSTLQVFRASLNTTAYTNLLTGAGTANQLTRWSAAGAVTGSSALTFDGITLAAIQGVGTSGSPSLLSLTGGAHTTLTASTEATDVNVNLARTVQFSTGAITTQRALRIQAPTYGFVGSSTITNAATVSISNAPTAGTNATLTNRYALWIEAGTTRFDALVQTKATATGGAGLNIPHGTAPTSPVNGDIWTTTAGLYIRINGTTVGPLN